MTNSHHLPTFRRTVASSSPESVNQSERFSMKEKTLHSLEILLQFLPNDVVESSSIIRPSVVMLLKAFFQKVWCHKSLISYRPSPLMSVISLYIFSTYHRISDVTNCDVNTSKWTIKMLGTEHAPFFTGTQRLMTEL